MRLFQCLTVGTVFLIGCLGAYRADALGILPLMLVKEVVTQVKDSQPEKAKCLIFVTSDSCEYCKSVEEAIKLGAAKGWEVIRVKSYPGTYGTPTLVKIVDGKVKGKLEGGPQTYKEIQQFLRDK